MTTRGKSKTELAYAAGIFDGEGYITILRATANRKAGRTHEYILVAGMSNTHRPTIEWLKEQWRGTTMLHNQVFKNRKRIFMWRVSGPMALGFIRDIYPYLRIKKPQADLAIAFQATKSRQWGVRGLSNDVLALRDDLCVQIRALNASRVPRPQRLSEGAPSTDG